MASEFSVRRGVNAIRVTLDKEHLDVLHLVLAMAVVPDLGVGLTADQLKIAEKILDAVAPPRKPLGSR